MSRTTGSIDYRTWKKQMNAYLRAVDCFKHLPEPLFTMYRERLDEMLPPANIGYQIRFWSEHRD